MARNTTKAADTQTSAEDRNAAKAAKFVELAPKRVDKATVAIRNVAKLAAKTYVYTPEQAKQVCDAMQAEVDSLRAAFDGGKPQTVGFSFKSADEGEDAGE